MRVFIDIRTGRASGWPGTGGREACEASPTGPDRDVGDVDCRREAGSTRPASPPAPSAPPPDKWGGKGLQPLRRLRRQLPINGEDKASHSLWITVCRERTHVRPPSPFR